jgi:fimbrial chaperone protein
MLRITTWAARAMALLLACVYPVLEASASSFIASPITFDLTSSKPMSILRLTNKDANDLRLQVHAVKWSTDGHIETQVNTDELILNPPIFTIKPGQQQFLRFGLRSVTPTAQEQSYRLIVDEIPDETSVVGKLGLRTVLRVSIPVFISPVQKNVLVTWHLVRKNQQYILVAANSGDMHMKINGFAIVSDKGTPLIANNDPAYILPGQRKEWPLATSSSLDRITLKILTPVGPIDEVLNAESE